jgi:plastocyanin
MTRPTVLIALAAGAALACAAPASAGPTKQKTVGVADNYYLPAKLTVKKGTTIAWKWPDEAIDVHDVKLKKGPKGVKRFQSEPASVSYRYKRKLTVPGTYRIVCTLHEEMVMKITVRKH